MGFIKQRRLGGFTVAESMISLAIGTVAIVGGMTLSQQEMRLVKSVRESNAASHALEERIEQLRLVNWRQMTDPEHLMKYYFPKRPASGQALPEVIERVTVSAYPDPRACAPLVIETNEYGTPFVLNEGSGWDKQRLARVNVRVNWIGTDGKERIRELASVISNAGINVTSLPAVGTDSSEGTTTSSSSGSTTSSTEPTSTSTDTTTTTTGTTGTTTTTTTPATARGRGNVAGKTGTK